MTAAPVVAAGGAVENYTVALDIDYCGEQRRER